MHDRVSSSLWRLYEDIEAEGFNIEVVQTEMLNEARNYTRYTGETEEFEILSHLQHNGGATNLIDFTTDYLIALFFACDGEPDKPGQVIILVESGEDFLIEYPSHPVHRVIAQKSVFVRPQKGYVEPFGTVAVPSDLKTEILDYLRTRHGISAESIYNDLHGFIKYQGIHQSAYTEFYKATTFHNNGDFQRAIEHFTNAIALAPQRPATYNNRGNVYSDMRNYRSAVLDYERALELNPEYAPALANLGVAYIGQGNYTRAIEYFDQALEMDESGRTFCNRGEAQLHLGAWDEARQDLIQAANAGIDIIESFRNDYRDVADFETRNRIELPNDIAEMLGR